MTKFNLVVELKNEKYCDGCPSFKFGGLYADCKCAVTGKSVRTSRPTWCPLLPRVEVKLEPTPLTPEEQAEYQKELENT